MVGRAFQAVYQEIRGLHQAAYILAIFAFGSQILALVRDRLLAYQFGAGVELDIYYTAFRIPDLLFVFFSSMLSVYVLIPFIAARIEKGGESNARQLLSQIFSIFLVAYAALALVVMVSAPTIAAVFFPGISGGTHGEELVLLMRILLLQPLLLGVSSLFGVITQMGQRFVLYAVSPLLYNFGIIFGIVALYPFFGLTGLAAGVVLGAGAHVAVQLPFVMKSPIMPRYVIRFEIRALLEVLRNSIPRTLTLSLHQLVLVILVGMAGVMTVGSVSVFQFAFNLQSVPLAVIGMSYSVAAFPTLARFFAKQEYHEFTHHVVTALRHIIFWSIPALALIVVIRAQLVRVILGAGAFDWNDTRLTAAALALFVLSLTAQAISLLIVRAFYAAGDTRTPLIITILSSLAAVGLSFGLYNVFLASPGFADMVESLLRVSTVSGTEILMLPLGYSIAMLGHTFVLLMIFIRKYQLPSPVLSASFFRASVAACLGAVASYGALNILVAGIKTDTLLGIFLQGFIAGMIGIGAIIAGYYVTRSPELIEVWHALRRRLFRARVVAPQDIDDLAV